MGGALLRPSSASKWIACPPSARFEQYYKADDGETVYTQEGTLAHELTERLILGFEFLDLSEIIEAFYLNNTELEGNAELMLGYARDFADFVCDIGGAIFTETKLAYNELIYGTGDAINLVGNKMYVSDLKYGAGKRVKAENNFQLMLYGLMALEKFGDHYDEVVLTIYQPRLGGLSSMSITPLELREWEAFEVIPAMQLAVSGQGEFKTGEHCTFCKAKANCLALFNEYSEVEKLSEFKGLTSKQIVSILDKGQAVKKFIEEVNISALRRALAGETFEGYTVGKSNGRRYFKDPEAVEALLFDEGLEFEDVYDVSLISLSQLEKKLKPKKFKKLLGSQIAKADGAPKLVKVVEWETADPYNPADVFDD